MKIESILRRVGGTTVELGAIAYKFQPDAEGKHVADVLDKEHIKRFLSIPEGFRSLEAVPAELLQPLPLQNVAGLDDSALSSHFIDVLAEYEKRFGPYQPAPLPAGVNGGTPLKQDVKLTPPATEQPPGGTGEQADTFNGETREQLAEKYKKLYGQNAHYRWSAETIAKKIAEQPPGGGE